MPFDDAEIKPKVSVKQQGAKSMFDNAPKKISKQESEKRASEVNDQLNSYTVRAAEVVPQFIKLLDDKTLPANKNVFANDLEKEVITKMVELARDMNVDEYEESESGSVNLIAFLLRCLLIQRDKINGLDYTITQLKSDLKTLLNKPVDNKS